MPSFSVLRQNFLRYNQLQVSLNLIFPRELIRPKEHRLLGHPNNLAAQLDLSPFSQRNLWELFVDDIWIGLYVFHHFVDSDLMASIFPSGHPINFTKYFSPRYFRCFRSSLRLSVQVSNPHIKIRIKGNN